MLVFSGKIGTDDVSTKEATEYMEKLSAHNDMPLRQAFSLTREMDAQSPSVLEADLNFISCSYNYDYIPTPDMKDALLYPIFICRWHTSPTHYTKRSGWKNYQLIYTYKGAGILNAGNEIFYLNPDTLCFLSCKPYHYYFSTDPNGWEYSFIHFTGPSAEYFYQTIAKKGSVFNNLDGTAIKQIYESFPVLAEENPDNFDLLFHLKMTALLGRLADCSPVQPKAILPDWLSKTQSYIIENYNSDWSIRELADAACISESRFSHAFRKYIGVSPIEYRDHLRVEHAKEYLVGTNLPIDVISENVGFHNLSNFYARFTRLAGISPGKYRRKTSFDS